MSPKPERNSEVELKGGHLGAKLGAAAALGPLGAVSGPFGPLAGTLVGAVYGGTMDVVHESTSSVPERARILVSPRAFQGRTASGVIVVRPDGRSPEPVEAVRLSGRFIFGMDMVAMDLEVAIDWASSVRRSALEMRPKFPPRLYGFGPRGWLRPSEISRLVGEGANFLSIDATDRNDQESRESLFAAAVVDMDLRGMDSSQWLASWQDALATPAAEPDESTLQALHHPALRLDDDDFRRLLNGDGPLGSP